MTKMGSSFRTAKHKPRLAGASELRGHEGACFRHTKDAALNCRVQPRTCIRNRPR